jgi:hypothetical protein
MPTLFRGVHSDPPTERDFWSNKRLGKPPRHEEISDEREYDSLSMWDTYETMRAVCQRFPRVGTHIAELEIPDDRSSAGIEFWPSGRPGHWSVRGDPAVLRACVVRVTPVGAE